MMDRLRLSQTWLAMAALVAWVIHLWTLPVPVIAGPVVSSHGPINNVLPVPIITSGALPTLSDCGTGTPSLDAGSNFSAGVVTVGTGTPDQCVLTFVPPFPAPNGVSCVVTDYSTNHAFHAVATVNTLTITPTGNFTNSDKVNYLCMGF